MHAFVSFVALYIIPKVRKYLTETYVSIYIHLSRISHAVAFGRWAQFWFLFLFRTPDKESRIPTHKKGKRSRKLDNT